MHQKCLCVYPKTMLAKKYYFTFKFYAKNEDTFQCPHFFTEFRRIYGVVFRTLLHGEATFHLRRFPAIISFDGNFCGVFAFIVDCIFNYRNYNQQKCDKCHLRDYRELSDRSYHEPCYFRETCSKQGTYKRKEFFR